MRGAAAGSGGAGRCGRAGGGGAGPGAAAREGRAGGGEREASLLLATGIPLGAGKGREATPDRVWDFEKIVCWFSEGER